MELSPLGSVVTPADPAQAQRCNFWTHLYPRLLASKPTKCKAKNRVRKKPLKASEKEKKLAELTTNEIDVEPSLRKVSALSVEEPQATTRRTDRGLDSNFPQNRQFVYGVKTKIPKDAKVYSSVKVVEKLVTGRPRRQSLQQQQTRPRNNTQLSYQLSVGLGAGSDPWAVYDNKQFGNSPIYIAPSRYQQEDPILNDTGLGPAGPPGYQPGQRAANKGSYDPFYPNFAGFGVKSAAVERDKKKVVVVEAGRPAAPRPSPHQPPRPYFPN